LLRDRSRSNGGRVSDTELLSLLEVAKAAAAEAGQALRDNRARWSSVEEVIGREVKVRADRKAEDMIVAALARAGDIPILTEETGWIGDRVAATKGFAWALDPLDGSVNYAMGYPHCAVSIGLLRDGKPVLGVVDCFLLGEAFSGVVGEGAWLNGAPIAVSAVANSSEGILNTGIPARAKADAESFTVFMTEMLNWRKVRMIGSAAAALAYVACGRSDFYRESGSMLWDVAGGLALVEAAGGAVRTVGTALDQPLRVGACNAVLAHLLDTL
jgi:myo-inositol-1(or 4)-monophosphatase